MKRRLKGNLDSSTWDTILVAAAGKVRYHLQDQLGIIGWDGGVLLYGNGAGGCLLFVILGKTCVYVMASSCDLVQ
jgi:hypothetical protein